MHALAGAASLLAVATDVGHERVERAPKGAQQVKAGEAKGTWRGKLQEFSRLQYGTSEVQLQALMACLARSEKKVAWAGIGPAGWELALPPIDTPPSPPVVSQASIGRSSPSSDRIIIIIIIIRRKEEMHGRVAETRLAPTAHVRHSRGPTAKVSVAWWRGMVETVSRRLALQSECRTIVVRGLHTRSMLIMELHRPRPYETSIYCPITLQADRWLVGLSGLGYDRDLTCLFPYPSFLNPSRGKISPNRPPHD